MFDFEWTCVDINHKKLGTDFCDVLAYARSMFSLSTGPLKGCPSQSGSKEELVVPL